MELNEQQELQNDYLNYLMEKDQQQFDLQSADNSALLSVIELKEFSETPEKTLLQGLDLKLKEKFDSLYSK